MKKHFYLAIIVLLILNFSCAQDPKPLDQEGENSMLKEETNYEMELIFEDENIIWSIEFFDDNSILAAVKSGTMFHYKNGKKTMIKGVPEIFLKGQGGLMDLALHPNFNENNWVYFSYASGNDKNVGNTTISRAKLIDNSLQNIEILYKAEPDTKKPYHFGGRIEFDNENYLYFSN